MRQKVICITGGTDGIGRAAALQLASKGSVVILHGRNGDRLEKVKREIALLSGNAKIRIIKADFSSLDEVAVMAETLLESEQSIDVLINNAGLYRARRELTVDGFETTFAVNYLAHFRLTLLLEPLLLKSRARIINVSSVDHLSAGFDFGNMQGERHYTGYDAYAFSKLCNIMFTVEHAERLEGTGVTVNTLDPGILATKLLHAGWPLSGEDPARGGERLEWLALAKDVEAITGCYFENDRQVSYSSLVEDRQLRQELWDISEKMLEPRG